MFVSVIATVLNEEKSVAGLLDSLLAQTWPPDEVVIVDGGSQDGTLAVLESYRDRLPLRVLVRPGCNISEGRNAAIAAARGDIIASTDSGVRLEPGWLEELVAPLQRNKEHLPASRPLPPSRLEARCREVARRARRAEGEAGGTRNKGEAQVVCGFFVPDPQTVFEAAMGATVLPGMDEIDPARFLPSSRSVAFTRICWEMVGGYPEWLDYCEDLIFDLSLKRAGVPFYWAPGALVHFRPRSNLRSFYRQYYQYARGDGKADLWRKRHAIRYGTYLGGLLALLGGLWYPWLWGLLLLAGLAYLWQPYRRLWIQTAGSSWSDRLSAAFWVPIIRATGDAAKMIGYPVGVRWRLTGGRRKMEGGRWEAGKRGS